MSVLMWVGTYPCFAAASRLVRPRAGRAGTGGGCGRGVEGSLLSPLPPVKGRAGLRRARLPPRCRSVDWEVGRVAGSGASVGRRAAAVGIGLMVGVAGQGRVAQQHGDET